MGTSNSIPRGHNNSLNNNSLNNNNNHGGATSNNNFRSNNSSFSGLQAPGSNRSIFDQPDQNFDLDDDMMRHSTQNKLTMMQNKQPDDFGGLSKEQLLEKLNQLTVENKKLKG